MRPLNYVETTSGVGGVGFTPLSGALKNERKPVVGWWKIMTKRVIRNVRFLQIAVFLIGMGMGIGIEAQLPNETSVLRFALNVGIAMVCIFMFDWMNLLTKRMDVLDQLIVPPYRIPVPIHPHVAELAARRATNAGKSKHHAGKSVRRTFI